MWCDNDTLIAVASVRAFFGRLAPLPSIGARIAVGSCNWRSQQQLASVGFDIASAGHHKKTLSTTKMLWVWTLQGYVAMGTAGMLCGWALQGHSAVGHCRDTL